MAIVRGLFEKNTSDDLIKALGNMIISGIEKKSGRLVFYDLLSDHIDRGKMLILSNGFIAKDESTRLIDYSIDRVGASHVLAFCSNGSGESFDALSAFDTREEKADFIEMLFRLVSEIAPELQPRIRRFYSYVMLILESEGSYTLQDVFSMDVDEASERTDGLAVEASEKRKMKRFMDDESMYSSFMNIENMITKLEDWGIVRFLSGEKKAGDVFQRGNIIIFHGDNTEDEAKRNCFMNSLLYLAEKYVMKKCLDGAVVFFNQNLDFMDRELMERMVQLNNDYQIASYHFIEDISRLIRNIGNSFLDHIKSCMVFRQGADENAEFWSLYFGQRDMYERHYSLTRKKGWNPFSNIMKDGGVVPSGRKVNSYTQTFQKAHNPIYKIEVFRELKEFEVMVYLNEPLMRRKCKVM